MTPRATGHAVFVVALAAGGCVGISGIRNGPIRDRMRAVDRVKNITYRAAPYRPGPYQVRGSIQEVEYERTGDVPDASRPFGFGIGGKTGVALGGTEPTARNGYAQDFYLFGLYAAGRWYVAPQLAFTMNLHGSSVMGRAQSALALPLELEAGVRVDDLITLYGAGGRSLWGRVGNADQSDAQTFWRMRGGGLFIVRDGGHRRYEIAVRLEAFMMSGSGTVLDYSAVGGLFQVDFTNTTSAF